MKKEYWFVIVLLIGVIVIIGSFYYISEVGNIPAYSALYISIVTAGYAALAKPSPNKIKKQEIYGQLKKTILNLIVKLESGNYQIINFDLWKSIRQDDRYHMADEKIQNRLDVFLERIRKYSSTIEKLQFRILPEIIKDTANEVFEKEPTTASSVDFAIIIFRMKREPEHFTTNVLNHLKMNHSLQDIINYTIEGERIKKEEVTDVKRELSYAGLKVEDEKQIAEFWSKCLSKLETFPEHQFVIKENDSLLDEAKEIKQELIKRIEKTIKS